MNSCDVFAEGNSQDLIARVRVAKSLWSRFWGLMGRRPLRPREGILIDPCSSVHTMFMRFPIDLVFLDDEDRVIKTVAALNPYRIAVGRGSRRVLEIEAGGVDRAGILVGDRLLIQNVA